MSTDVFTVVLSSLQDLLKYKIIAYVNTGDKTQDNVINTFLIAVLTMIFTHFSWQSVKRIFIRCKVQKIADELTKENMEYYKMYAKTIQHKFTYVTWSLSDEHQNFTNKICKIFTHLHHLNNSNDSIFYSPVLKKTQPNRPAVIPNTNHLYGSMHTHEFYPLYINQRDIVCLTKGKCDRGFCISICYTSDQIFNEFIKHLDLVEIDNKEHKNNELQHHVHGYKSTNCVITPVIYPDRNMDLFVSRHKQTIVNALDLFIHTNKNGTNFGGYGTYNLGIMVHGEPGTGKTFLIKAIANYLKKNVLMVDMRDVDSKSDLDTLILENSTKIICLDEFDFMQRAIKSRATSSTSSASSTSSMDEQFSDISMEAIDEKQSDRLVQRLKTQRADLVKQAAMSLKTNDLVVEELKKLDDQIKKIENALTLDNFLTVLDGVQETRGRIIIATTNYIDRIDPALMRSGRFDLKIKLERFNRDEIIELLEKMYVNELTDETRKLIYSADFIEDTFVPVDIINTVLNVKDLNKVIDLLCTRPN